MYRSRMAGVTTRAAVLLMIFASSLACQTSMDCELNGACVSGVCSCDKGWTGPTCGVLNLESNMTVAYGYGGLEPNTSCWGGGPPTYDGATKMYHLFVTEIAGHCGMATWSRMSQAVHTVSENPEGPYKRIGLAIPTQTHNVLYAYSPTDEMHLIYHIFGGTSPESCNPYLKCTNGTTPGGKGIRPPNTPWPAPTCDLGGGAHIHYSKSLDGPWLNAGALKINAPGLPSTGGNSNPAPFIFPNGTVIMFGRGKDANRLPNHTVHVNHNIFLYRADSWNGTYDWIKGSGVEGAVNIGNGKILTEDPVIYRTSRGFHALLHSHPDLTHAWSEDGLTWQWSAEVSGPPNVLVGTDNERPRVFQDANGDLDIVFISQVVGDGDGSRLLAYKTK